METFESPNAVLVMQAEACEHLQNVLPAPQDQTKDTSDPQDQCGDDIGKEEFKER